LFQGFKARARHLFKQFLDFRFLLFHPI
jgi:hypothetical protein